MKKTVGFTIILLIILVGAFAYYILFFNNELDSSLTIKKENFEQKDFLKNKQAVMYFSTTADQDMDNKGISYAVFIDGEGVASGYKMKGLELGSIAKNKNEVLLEDKNTLRLIGKTYQEFSMKKAQYTGERTGYLEEQNLYFSIYNTGVNYNTGGYDSNVMFGNTDGFKKGNIPYYILTSGVDKNEVLVLTNDIEKNQYDLRKVLFANDELTVNDIVQLKNEDGLEYVNLSPIVSDDHYYYIVLSELKNTTREHTVLFRINKETLVQEKIKLSAYKNEDNLTSIIPYNIKNSAYLFNGEFYYVNGLGEVFSVNTKTNKVKIRFTIENASKDGVRHNEETFFQEDKLYIVRYDDKRKNKYYIETYSLKSGEKIKEINIKGLNEILSSVKGKSIYSYDFKMLK